MYELFNCIDLSLGGKSQKKRKRISQLMNNATWKNAYISFCLKALARYDVEGLTPEMSKRVFLTSLLYHGNICVFEKDGAVLALPATPAGNPNINGDYLSCYVYGRNGFNEEIPLYIPGSDDNEIMKKGYLSLNQNKKPRGVLIRENEYMYPFINQCIEYASKVADSMRSSDVIAKNMKIPAILSAAQEMVPNIERFFEEVDDNNSYVISSGITNPVDKISYLPFDHHAESMKVITDRIDWLINKFDDLCYFNSNANPDKKERLLVDEVNSNNDSIDKKKKKFRDYIQEQFDFCNKCLGTNIKLKEEENNDAIQRMGEDSKTKQMDAGRSDSRDA